MEINQDILTERERCKAIIESKIDDRVKWRRKNIHKRGTTSIMEKLKDDLIFLIDNPDYKKKESRQRKKKSEGI